MDNKDLQEKANQEEIELIKEQLKEIHTIAKSIKEELILGIKKIEDIKAGAI